MIKILKEESFISWDIYDNEHEDAIRNEISSKYIRIDYVVVDSFERGKGRATTMMQNVINEIEKEYPDLPIYIVASDIESSTDIERLVSFYERFGFNIVDTVGDGVLMKK